MVATRASAAAARPQPVTIALILLALVIIGNVVGPLLPGSEGEVIVGIVIGLIGIVAALGLWLLRRWGFIATVVVAALNLLLDGGVFAADLPASIKVVAGMHLLACAIIIWLVTRSEARRAYR